MERFDVAMFLQALREKSSVVCDDGHILAGASREMHDGFVLKCDGIEYSRVQIGADRIYLHNDTDSRRMYADSYQYVSIENG